MGPVDSTDAVLHIRKSKIGNFTNLGEEIREKFSDGDTRTVVHLKIRPIARV